MTNRARHLLDVNVLIALTDPDHAHHALVTRWFDAAGHVEWGVCAFTEAGFVRVTSNSRFGNRTAAGASQLLQLLANRPGYRYWPITDGWISLVEPFRARIVGHQQIGDAFLLGLAIKEDGVLVTLDRAIRTMAGARLGRHVLVLE
jgi:toxin-antitoxin system PIN domain toxin